MMNAHILCRLYLYPSIVIYIYMLMMDLQPSFKPRDMSYGSLNGASQLGKPNSMLRNGFIQEEEYCWHVTRTTSTGTIVSANSTTR